MVRTNKNALICKGVLLQTRAVKCIHLYFTILYVVCQELMTKKFTI